MTIMREHERIFRRTLCFFFVLGKRLGVSPKTRQRVSKMVVAKRNPGILGQRQLELLDRLYGAICILIRSSEKNMCERIRRLQLHRGFQSVSRGPKLIVLQKNQCGIELHIELCWFELKGLVKPA